MSESFTGRCLCGAVTYRCGPAVLAPSFCHCESCRRASGSHVVAWFTVARSTFEISDTAGSYESSPRVWRQLCPRCGTPLTYRNEQYPQTIDITIATLDLPDSMVPTAHIWMADAVSWDRPNDGLPQFAGFRPE